jgi:transcription elongation factor Elf1
MAAPSKTRKLDTLTCPFYCYPEAVGCHIDRKDWIARAACRICSESYFTSAHTITEAVDIYGEWIDACEVANEGVRRCRPRLVEA